MQKKSLHLLVLTGSFITPIIGIPLLVSCKKIDYEQDIDIKFKQTKSTFFASDVLEKITVKSKSNKVKYTAKIIKFDDAVGEVELSITPNYKGTKKAFNLKISGFAKKLEIILKKIETIDLQDKDKYKVEDYKTNFENDLSKKVILKTSIGKNLQEFLSFYELIAKFTLEVKDAKQGIATLKSEFSLGEQKQTLETEISGFKTRTIITETIEKIKSITPTIDLKDKDGKTVNDYATTHASNLKDQIVFQIEGKSLETFLGSVQNSGVN
ncbi:lipoprotein 17-related variable surface protein [Metamycoplasma hyosynoviae]|uniref:lipoprotein 17-related variable surface protein n=1 Tax=Metamycoplasma hyosynoviae TaxID=29559 RepID=UPI002358C32E|nr:lipoprotein 17-related variable surface protein [Metamycoplasma hyosynoviae]MDC8937931.1 lipoprotein 17-related variable surface protein [Metamycoplasma hyosynoviae]